MAHTNSKEKNMNMILKTLLAASLIAFAAPASAELNIFACEPEWAALAHELAEHKGDVYSATVALQDPHHVQARPSLIAHARRAQLVVCTGAELEIGWLPVILRESGNPDIAPGKPGNFEASRYITLLDVPTMISRAEGDVHPEGNPHIQLDARNYLPIARALTDRMIQLDPADTVLYREHLKNFTLRWQAAIARWEKEAAPLRGQAIIVHHESYSYLNNWLGMKEVAELEPKPGMEPSVSHMSQVLEQLQQHPARMVIRAAYQDPKPAEWMSEHAHIPVVVLPFSVGGDDNAKDLFGLFDDTIARLLAGLK
jgi:zinc/manganese transport system substrate-binding protein